MKFFLGLEIARSSNSISLSQRKYALEVLEDSGYLGCKPVHFHTDSKLQLTKNALDALEDPSQYRRLIGRLLYLTITHLDLSYSVNSLA